MLLDVTDAIKSTNTWLCLKGINVTFFQSVPAIYEIPVLSFCVQWSFEEREKKKEFLTDILKYKCFYYRRLL